MVDIDYSDRGLFTDFYELTMAQGYFLSGKKDETAVFDYFFRANPFDGGYVIFAGVDNLLESLEQFHFTREDLQYLRKQGFHQAFLDYLENFKIQATITGMREGEVAFPTEPVLQVEGSLIETQLIETLLLNYLNFE